MGNSTAQPDLAQLLQHLIHGAAGVQQYRQVEFARQLELRDKETFLLRNLMIFNEKIQSNLANCDGFTLAQDIAQAHQVFRCRLVCEQGMNAVGWLAIGKSLAQMAHALEIGAFYRRNDDAADTDPLGGLQQFGLGMTEFRGIEVAVGVYEHLTASSK